VGNHTDWQRETSIERYAAPLDLAIVMPEVHRSFYTDMANGFLFWTFISEELPIIARSLFPLSKERKDNFVAGLSMGGYGAFKLALSHPERFAAAASLSGGMDIAAIVRRPGKEWQREISGSLAILKKLPVAKRSFLPGRKCGKIRRSRACTSGAGDDFSTMVTSDFISMFSRLDLSLTYEEGQVGTDFSAWDQQISGYWMATDHQVNEKL
jgi:pimeloyl-ACP methyl ester carboxylesterase